MSIFMHEVNQLALPPPPDMQERSSGTEILNLTLVLQVKAVKDADVCYGHIRGNAEPTLMGTFFFFWFSHSKWRLGPSVQKLIETGHAFLLGLVFIIVVHALHCGRHMAVHHLSLLKVEIPSPIQTESSISPLPGRVPASMIGDST